MTIRAFWLSGAAAVVVAGSKNYDKMFRREKNRKRWVVPAIYTEETPKC